MTAQPDLPVQPSRTGHVSARTQLLGSAAVGLLVGVPVAVLAPAGYGVLAGWDAAALVYMAWVWLTVWRMDAEDTARYGVRTDPTRPLTDAVLLGAAVASLVAVGYVLVRAGHSRGATELAQVGLGVASVGLSWALVHTVFTLMYARIYYTGADGGVDFKQEQPPRYSDFAYLAFTIGMTFQVSDTELCSTAMRRAVMRQALLSYLLGTGILATTVNLVATLSSR